KIQKDNGADKRGAGRYYSMARDFLKACAQVWGESWGNDNYMVTKPVTLKAMIRVCADLSAQDADPEDDRIERWRQRLSPWSERLRDFRSDGFYERFAAKGHVDRVARRHRDLARGRPFLGTCGGFQHALIEFEMNKALPRSPAFCEM